MKLSYSNITGDGERHEISAEITTDHANSSYGQPVIILDGDQGNLLDGTSWILLNYRVVSASEDEIMLLRRWIETVYMASGITAMQSKGGQTVTERKREHLRSIASKGGAAGKGKPKPRKLKAMIPD